MPDIIPNNDGVTRPYDESLARDIQKDLQTHRELDLRRKMAAEVAAKRAKNPRFFDEKTIPVLSESDILVNRERGQEQDQELSRQMAEDVTFLNPKDVHLDEGKSDSGNFSFSDMVSHTELAPADVISTIESQISKAALVPGFAVGRGKVDQKDLLPEMIHSLNLTKEDFLLKEKLEDADAYKLYELIIKDPQDPDVIAFTLRIAPTRLDFDVFWNNIEYLSPQFVQSVLCAGSYQETELDFETGKQKTLAFYSGTTLKRGGMGHVFYAQMADSEERKLRLVLIKVPLEKALNMSPTISEMAFEDEEERARQFKKMAVEKAGDARLANLLVPLYRGHGFLVMPLISNRDGQTIDLRQMAEKNSVSTQQWAKCLAGAVRGAILASESGFINGDMKPVNIMDGKEGGVLIDWGGFIDKTAFDRGEISIRTNQIYGNLYPLMENRLKAHVSDRNWELNNGNIQRSPAYTSLHLLAQELSGQMPVGTTHKFSMYRILEKYFLVRGKAEGDTDEFMKKNELEKTIHPALDIPSSRLNPAEQLLYDLYQKLHKAHRHPFRFRDDNPDHGIDPEYVSLEEVAVRLDEIANIKP